MLKAEIVECMRRRFVVVEVAAILEVNVEETSRTKLKINTLYLWRSRKKLIYLIYAKFIQRGKTDKFSGNTQYTEIGT